MKRTLFIASFLIVALHCFSQNYSIVNEYKASANGKEMKILLFSDSTYTFNTYWGEYHGIWAIAEESDTIFDRLCFYDFEFTTKNAFFFSHISLNDTLFEHTVDIDDGSKEYFVTMYDLIGEEVPYYSVCFLDSSKAIINCQHNANKKVKQSIPINTRAIGMNGEARNMSTYFKCDYSSNEGSIAFIIGPNPTRFKINKERDIIIYRPCYCDDYHAECSIVFKRHRN